MTRLWRTEVGSRLWGMQRPDSDYDYMECYLADTAEILKGLNHGSGSHQQQGPSGDIQSSEAGKWVDELLKGNINYIIGLWSNRVAEMQGEELLKVRVYLERSKNIVPSLRGLTLSCIKDANRTQSPTWSLARKAKKLATASRQLNFGMRYLAREPLVFDPAPHGFETTIEDVMEELDLLDGFYQVSAMPERPAEGPLREWLFGVRVRNLQERNPRLFGL